MPTLNWIGRKAVENHHQQVPFHLLKDVPDLSVGDPGLGNLLVEGDNLLALKALLPYYGGQVKCIYIDPPYNTGNEGWVYNDNVNSPEMREWLGKTVGKEADDLTRHDKWLCMMYPRLWLLWQFLRPDGSIWISMDDSEFSALRFLTDEVFGRDRFVAANVWQKRYSRENREAIGDVHEYVLVYAKDPERFKASRHRVPIDEAQAKVYKNPNDDPRGRWRGIPMTAQGWRPNQMYEITTPAGTKHKPPEGRCWSMVEGEFQRLLSEGRIYFGKQGKSQPSVIRYLSEVEGFVPWTWWPHNEVGHTDESRKEIRSILGTQTAFDTPKPVRLIQRILTIATDPSDIVLDSFAGSGTTGHAVMQTNKEDGGNRRFILVEMDAKICRGVTAERLRRVSQGYENGAGKQFEGLGQGFRFASLGDALFDERGNIRDTVRFADLAPPCVLRRNGRTAAPRACPEFPADRPMQGDGHLPALQRNSAGQVAGRRQCVDNAGAFGATGTPRTEGDLRDRLPSRGGKAPPGRDRVQAVAVQAEGGCAMILKNYQAEALDWLDAFFKRCKTASNPRAAYEETTKEWRGVALHYRPLPTLAHVPYVCLRIPTGGGKTLVGGLAIERANRSLLFTRHSVTLWLVPSEPIREQTLKALRDPSNLLHQSVFSALGEVTVMEVEQALRVKPHVLNGSNAVIVATMQAFKQEDVDRLNVYKQNTDMMPHFEDVSDPAVKGNLSLVDALRMRHPFVIVDEAHNQGTPLAFETLARFEPSAILELTATPDRSRQPSNVLFSVGASALQAADMIKLPLELVRRDNWQDALRDAISCLNSLQARAAAERAATGDYLRPVMLLQAERKDPDHETLVPERVKASLVADFGVPEEEIAIATGVVDEIAGEDILAEKCRKRFIITIDKLREGWDCPFAYILCSFRNTNSSTAAEQILGRILRMPGARRKTQQELNEAYAFVTSSDFQATVESLRDGLVKNGFERQETKDLICVPEEPQGDDLFTLTSTVTFTAPEIPEPESIPAGLEAKVEIAPEAGAITLRGKFSAKQVEALEAVFRTDDGKEAIRQAVKRLGGPQTRPPRTPSELGKLFRVPLLALRQGDLWEPFEETHLLQGDWRLLDCPAELTEGEFRKPERTPQGGRFFVREESIKFEYFDNVETQLALFEFRTEWNQVDLVDWLAKNIPDDSILPDEKAAYLNAAVTALIQARGLSLEDLNYAKFRLRAALEEKIKAAKRDAMRKVHGSLLSDPAQFTSDGRCEMVFRQGRYAYDWPYAGFTDLPKHFFPQIGNLRAEGEELDCAVFLATQLEGVTYWVRNVERKPTSFSLQTATDRFYPDFVCRLTDERILVVEYKNTKDWDLPDNAEKRQLGELWERRSGGKGLFIMPRGKDWAAVRQKIAR